MKLGGRFFPVKPFAISQTPEFFDVFIDMFINMFSGEMPIVLIAATAFYTMADESFIPKLTRSSATVSRWSLPICRRAIMVLDTLPPGGE